MHIAIVAGNFALVKNDKVIGVVVPINETQWSFHALVEGDNNEVCNYVPLNYALQAALKFKPY